MNKLIVFILTLLPVFSYSQVTSINIDTSVSQVIIINNGTMIENNGGTVNVNNGYVEPERVPLPPPESKYYYSPKVDNTHIENVDTEDDNRALAILSFIFFIVSIYLNYMLLRSYFRNEVGSGALLILTMSVPVMIILGYATYSFTCKLL